MKKFVNLTILIIIFSITPLLYAQQLDYKGLPQWSEQQEDITNYWLYTPDNLESGKVYPIALFLHGCCPKDEVLRPRNTVDPPLRMWHNFADNVQATPTYIVAPVSKRGWTQHIDNLKKVIDDLVANGQGDPQRIYIAGFSMGGGGTWQFIGRYPDYFAAALPMGSGLRGDIEQLKNIPIWTNIGAEDRNAPRLKDSVAVFRAENHDPRGALEWVTGVNPRYTEHDGIGHGVQWDAVSTQDLLDWAYNQVNDGNAKPVVYFKTPKHMQTFEKGQPVDFDLFVDDDDSAIEKLRVFVNGRLELEFDAPPYSGQVKIENGDNILSATAFDADGKSSTADLPVRTDCQPRFISKKLTTAQQGELYDFQIDVHGNAELLFELTKNSAAVPPGLALSKSGWISGIPQVSGKVKLTIQVTDVDDDQTVKTFKLKMKAKDDDSVIVSNVASKYSQNYNISKLTKGCLPFTGKNSETNISDTAAYAGMTFIQTYNGDRDSTDVDMLSFEVDEDVIVYVAYEKCDHLYTSTIPEWLNDFTQEPGDQIEAQYFYFDVYSKKFPQGKITLPAAAAKANNVNNNYFVLVKKQ